MSRNFNVGSRSIESAVAMFLDGARQRKELSFSSVAAHKARASLFFVFARPHGVLRLEDVTADIVLTYGAELRFKVEQGHLKPSTAQNRISSVNRVMDLANPNWVKVCPVADCNIPRRSNLRVLPPPSQTAVDLAIRYLDGASLERVARVVELTRAFGLRCKEACLINCKNALAQAQSRGLVEVRDGTKGGKLREVPILNPQQIEVLQRAAHVQGNERNLIPSGMRWIDWLQGPLRDGRKKIKAAEVKGYHEFRAAYACARYSDLTGHSAPCVAGKRLADVQADLGARLTIAQELGHNRVDVVANYVGGRA